MCRWPRSGHTKSTQPADEDIFYRMFRRITPRSSSHTTYGGNDDDWLPMAFVGHHKRSVMCQWPRSGHIKSTQPADEDIFYRMFRRITPRSSSHPTYGGNDDDWLPTAFVGHHKRSVMCQWPRSGHIKSTQPADEDIFYRMFRRITPRSSSHPTYGGNDDDWLPMVFVGHHKRSVMCR